MNSVLRTPDGVVSLRPKAKLRPRKAAALPKRLAYSPASAPRKAKQAAAARPQKINFSRRPSRFYSVLVVCMTGGTIVHRIQNRAGNRYWLCYSSLPMRANLACHGLRGRRRLSRDTELQPRCYEREPRVAGACGSAFWCRPSTPGLAGGVDPGFALESPPLDD